MPSCYYYHHYDHHHYHHHHHDPIEYSSPSIPPLSAIINLEPTDVLCAGIAPSKGRRCHNHTNAPNRSTAMSFLYKGTKDLQAGRPIDALLRDLGPLVLCWRHKDQASGLTRGWMGRVCAYLNERVAASTPYRVSNPSVLSRRDVAPARQLRSAAPVRSTRPEPPRAAPELAGVDMTLNDLVAQTRRIEESFMNPSIIPARSSLSQREDRRSSTSAVARPSSARSSTSRNTRTPEERVDVTARRHSTESANPPTIASTVPRSTQAQTPVRQSRAPASSVSSQSQNQTPDSRPATTDTVVRGSSSARDQDRRDAISQVRRREVKGECGICLCRLRVAHHDEEADENEESEHSGEEDHDDDNDDQDDADDADDDDDDNDDKDDDDNDDDDDELVWCRAHCGVNFHKPCIDQWLAVADVPTCPACRRIWRR